MFSSMLAQFVEAVAKAAGGGVALERGEGKDVLATPAITVTGAGRGAIAYLALPVDREAPPFIEALHPENRGAGEGPLTRLREIDQPAQILIFIAQTCPHCPGAVRAANRLARASDKISTTIIDAQRVADLAARFNIQSVPATVIDQRLTLTGVMPAERLLEKILQRNTPQFQASVLLSMIESSRFDDATAHVLGDGGPTDLRGDTADLLGQIGHIRAKPALEALLSDPNPDVAEIAAEAIEALK
jgi:alkyl hydroperoxide reductase subunit AhpF